MTMQGPRSSIKLTDYVINAVIKCKLKILDDTVVTEQVLKQLLEYAQENGFGADRSQEIGKFDGKITAE